jgi:hypothetical protein
MVAAFLVVAAAVLYYVFFQGWETRQRQAAVTVLG